MRVTVVVAAAAITARCFVPLGCIRPSRKVSGEDTEDRAVWVVDWIPRL